MMSCLVSGTHLSVERVSKEKEVFIPLKRNRHGLCKGYHWQPLLCLVESKKNADSVEEEALLSE